MIRTNHAGSHDTLLIINHAGSHDTNHAGSHDTNHAGSHDTIIIIKPCRLLMILYNYLF